jgi:ribosomal protein L37E
MYEFDHTALDNCSRCGFKTYEQLASHGHCIECGYSLDEVSNAYTVIPEWALPCLKN